MIVGLLHWGRGSGHPLIGLSTYDPAGSGACRPHGLHSRAGDSSRCRPLCLLALCLGRQVHRNVGILRASLPTFTLPHDGGSAAPARAVRHMMHWLQCERRIMAHSMALRPPWGLGTSISTWEAERAAAARTTLLPQLRIPSQGRTYSYLPYLLTYYITSSR